MAGCGYVCPKCEGKEYLDDGSICDWCVPPKTEPQTPESEVETTE